MMKIYGVLLCLLVPALIGGRVMADVWDGRGPAQYAGLHVVTNSEGMEAVNPRTTAPMAHPGSWWGRWITVPGGGATVLLRRTITLAEAPRAVRAWVTASVPYRLYINGTLADRGPADSGRDFDGGSSRRQFYNERDLGFLFHAGRNVIAVQMADGGAAFLGDFRLTTGDGVTQNIGSDGTWRGESASYLTDGGWTDTASGKPVGWQTPAYDDSAWAACVLADGVRDSLTLSELPPCMEARYPVLGIDRVTGGVQASPTPFHDGHAVTVTSDGSFAVRFDRVLPAYFGIAVEGGAGAQITLEPHETNTPGHNNHSATITLRDGVQYYESPGFASVGVINVTLSHVTTPIRILDVSAVATSQPVSYAGSFACSDATLNRVWSSCRWATQICLQTWHLDSPHNQEPISDYGDYLIEDLATFLAFGNDPALARQDLLKWAWVMRDRDYKTFHTSYRLLWLQSLVQYYQYTGDAALVKELAPDVYALLDQYHGYRGKNGLISNAPNYMFMDWVTMDGFECHHPPAVIGQGYMTAFYAQALKDGEVVAEVAGDPARVQYYTQERADVTAAYNRELWDPQKGLYRDGKPFQSDVAPSHWLPADTDIETWSAQNNALAVLYDLAPADRQQQIIRTMMAQTPWNVRPYYMHFVLNAVAHAGLFDELGTVWMRNWHIIPETQTFYEMGDQGDLSHGWIATPLCQMSERVLGVRPAAPGYRVVSIRPTLCDLQWAKGSVPTPHGPVAVGWLRWSDGLKLSVSVPDGTQADVAIPIRPTQAWVTVGDRNIWHAGKGSAIPGVSRVRAEGVHVDVHLMPGHYTFVARERPHEQT